MASLAATGWLAQPPPKPPQGPEFGGSSPIALVVVLLLAVALVLLIRSMNKHLRKVPKSFNGTDEQRPAGDGDGEAPDEPKEPGQSDGEPNATKNGGGKPSSG
jgi:hypothetical protein